MCSEPHYITRKRILSIRGSVNFVNFAESAPFHLSTTYHVTKFNKKLINEDWIPYKPADVSPGLIWKHISRFSVPPEVLAPQTSCKLTVTWRDFVRRCNVRSRLKEPEDIYGNANGEDPFPC